MHRWSLHANDGNDIQMACATKGRLDFLTKDYHNFKPFIILFFFLTNTQQSTRYTKLFEPKERWTHTRLYANCQLKKYSFLTRTLWTWYTRKPFKHPCHQWHSDLQNKQMEEGILYNIMCLMPIVLVLGSCRNTWDAPTHRYYIILFRRILSFWRGNLSRGAINCGIVIPPDTMISE